MALNESVRSPKTYLLILEPNLEACSGNGTIQCDDILQAQDQLLNLQMLMSEDVR